MINRSAKPRKMEVKFLCLILLCCTLTSNSLSQIIKPECVSGKYPPTGRPAVPNMVVNLDLAPYDRWTAVVKDKGPQIKNLLVHIKAFIRGFGNSSHAVIDFIDNDLGYLASTIPQPFSDEIRGIAHATGLNLGEIVLYNIFYEIFTVCTSIVAEDSSGMLYHARNLDFGLFLGWNPKNHTWQVTEALKPMIVTLDFQRGGKTVFRSVQFAGYVGMITGMKPGVLTLTMNERFNLDGGFIGVIEWILGQRKGVQWVNFLTRSILENATSYNDAKQKLINTEILAPAYFILGGNKSGEGCIITRAREKAEDVWDLGTRNSTWYLLQTNYDNWKAPLFLDDRRGPGKKCMEKKTQKSVGFPGLFDVLSSKPVLNKLTTYTALMQVNSGKMEAYLQDCPDPCIGW